LLQNAKASTAKINNFSDDRIMSSKVPSRLIDLPESLGIQPAIPTPLILTTAPAIDKKEIKEKKRFFSFIRKKTTVPSSMFFSTAE
jgi:hypothetical protein